MYYLKSVYCEFYRNKLVAEYLSVILWAHEPVCGVKAAVEENKIALSRYTSYLSILEEVKENKARNRR